MNGAPRKRTMFVTLLALAGVTAALVRPGLPRVVYNATGSLPLGWYRIDRDLASPGYTALVVLPAGAAHAAAARGILPLGRPVLKVVAAQAPQTVCTTGGAVLIDGVWAAPVSDRGVSPPLHLWKQCRHLVGDEIFLLNPHPASYDSRYFGPVPASSVVGIAHPVWTWAEHSPRAPRGPINTVDPS